MKDDGDSTPNDGGKLNQAEAGKDALPAFQQIRRLIGVTLPEQEARTVLQSIHEYKWLEAEKAGFDIWAAIQPDCPLRAAAIHWKRRYMMVKRTARGAAASPASTGPAADGAIEPSCREDVLAAAAAGITWLTSDVDLLPAALRARARALRTASASPWLVMPAEEDDPLRRECALRPAPGGASLEVLAAGSGELEAMHTLNRESFAGIELSSVLLRDRCVLYPRDGAQVRQDYSAVGDSKVGRVLGPFLRAMFPVRGCPGLEPVPAEALDALPGTVALALRRTLVPGEQVLALAVQEKATECARGFPGWRRRETIPAGVLAVTSARVALITAGRDGLPSNYGTTCVLVPLEACDAVTSGTDRATGALRATIRFGGVHETSMSWHPRQGGAVAAALAVAESLISARAPRASRAGGAPE